MKRCPLCNRVHTADDLVATESIGVQSFEGEALSLFNCSECGTTLAVPLMPWPADAGEMETA